MKKLSIIFTAAFLINSCKNSDAEFEASGTFEAEETIISSEANGEIKEFNIEEGQTLKPGQVIGYIDSTQLFLKKKQLEAQKKTTLNRKPNISAQLSALKEQLKQAEKEQKRVSNLVKADAGTQKQLDDLESQIAVLKSTISAQESTLGISSSGLDEESGLINIQIEQINNQLSKYKITNPVYGTVLVKYAMANEISTYGKPLYKIADLSDLILRAYITADQFNRIKLGQAVKVNVDERTGNTKEYAGIIEWISNKAEFTPKTIQTKDERANLVYAIKVRVKNNGFLKIGMYGEIKL